MIAYSAYSCFSYHNIFQKENGDVYSFGNNQYGQCGTGDPFDYNRDKIVYKPTKIMNNPNIKLITVGETCSFYIEKNGDLYGCGNNNFRMLGIEKEIKFSSKFVFICSDVKQVFNSIKFTIIQKNDGKIYVYGNMGLKESNDKFEVQISDIISFTSGNESILFLKENGEVWVMGSNGKGQCGLGKEIRKVETPTLLLTDKNIFSVCCGFDYSFILTRDDKGNTILKCFGENEFGELGLGHSNTQYEIASIDSFPNISSIHCGSGHSLLLTNEGDVYGCGFNYYGQIPLGGDHETKNPLFTKTILSNISHITTGFNHSVFLKNKEIFICGRGNYGQIGNGENKEISDLVKLDFDDLKLMHGHQIRTEWSILNHKLFGKKFRETVLFFLLCLKHSKELLSNKIKLPKPLQYIVIKFSL
eukprot:TRINITY_DN1132_c0_g2_i1.p1 TRINITY_DN1132_c0_g2~~TRINITY_DN1132_c0_g2_i1.p1  ORF type:complete len:416 (-),score=88.22 TRINITY_DN1132_c0_g2_i1:27-1274(-)